MVGGGRARGRDGLGLFLTLGDRYIPLRYLLEMLMCRWHGARTSARSPWGETVRRRCLSVWLASYVADPPYPSRSPRAHPSGWTRTQYLDESQTRTPRASVLQAASLY